LSCFAEIVRASGATPALYMVWPSTSRASDFPGVSTSYGAAARAVNGRLLPAGDAWRKVLREHRDITLYSDDGLHPTLAGSYLAALVIYRGQDAAGRRSLIARQQRYLRS
jgi:hypothetical protein